MLHTTILGVVSEAFLSASSWGYALRALNTTYYMSMAIGGSYLLSRVICLSLMTLSSHYFLPAIWLSSSWFAAAAKKKPWYRCATRRIFRMVEPGTWHTQDNWRMLLCRRQSAIHYDVHIATNFFSDAVLCKLRSALAPLSQLLSNQQSVRKLVVIVQQQQTQPL